MGYLGMARVSREIFKSLTGGTSMTFEEALTALKNGDRVARRSWQLYDPGSYIFKQDAYPTGVAIDGRTARGVGENEGTVMRIRPYLMVRLTDDSLMVWGPSQLDLFATDWQVVLA